MKLPRPPRPSLSEPRWASGRPASPRSFKELGDESVEVVFGALANAIRRAREIAEAIEARGGVPTVAPETHPFARVDALALVISAMAVAAMAVLR
jgi:energy-coupling factor transporter transmembrane protein EcfT